MIDDEVVKPSKLVYSSAKVSLRINPIWREFTVLEIPPSRIGAKLVPVHIIEITPEVELEKLRLIDQANRQNRQQGLKGRPTKKDRRKLDGWQD